MAHATVSPTATACSFVAPPMPSRNSVRFGGVDIGASAHAVVKRSRQRIAALLCHACSVRASSAALQSLWWLVRAARGVTAGNRCRFLMSYRNTSSPRFVSATYGGSGYSERDLGSNACERQNQPKAELLVALVSRGAGTHPKSRNSTRLQMKNRAGWTQSTRRHRLLGSPGRRQTSFAVSTLHSGALTSCQQAREKRAAVDRLGGDNHIPSNPCARCVPSHT